MLHARDEALRVVRVRHRRYNDLVVGEHADGVVADIEVVTEELVLRLLLAAFVDRANLDVGAEELDRAFDGAFRGVRAVNVRRRHFAAGPLMRQHRGEIGRVIVVQVSEENRADGLKA